MSCTGDMFIRPTAMAEKDAHVPFPTPATRACAKDEDDVQAPSTTRKMSRHVHVRAGAMYEGPPDAEPADFNIIIRHRHVRRSTFQSWRLTMLKIASTMPSPISRVGRHAMPGHDLRAQHRRAADARCKKINVTDVLARVEAR